MSEFTGIPAVGLHFLEALAENNIREWFEANKQTYLDQLQAPTLALIVELGKRLKTITPDIQYDTRTNGSGSLMRINRDTRFSPDKTPYKTNVTFMFWEGAGKKTEKPGFGMRFDASGGGLLAGIYGFPKPMLNAYREAVLDDELGPELIEAVEQVKKSGNYTIGGEQYRRVPQGFPADHERANWLRYGGLHAFAPQISPDELTSPQLVDHCFAHFVEMAPIQRWLVKVDQKVK